MVRSHAGKTDSEHKVVQLSESTRLHLQIGDLTKWSGDAIVNAGNMRRTESIAYILKIQMRSNDL